MEAQLLPFYRWRNWRVTRGRSLSWDLNYEAEGPDGTRCFRERLACSVSLGQCTQLGLSVGLSLM